MFEKIKKGAAKAFGIKMGLQPPDEPIPAVDLLPGRFSLMSPSQVEYAGFMDAASAWAVHFPTDEQRAAAIAQGWHVIERAE